MPLGSSGHFWSPKGRLGNTLGSKCSKMEPLGRSWGHFGRPWALSGAKVTEKGANGLPKAPKSATPKPDKPHFGAFGGIRKETENVKKTKSNQCGFLGTLLDRFGGDLAPKMLAFWALLQDFLKNGLNFVNM